MCAGLLFSCLPLDTERVKSIILSILNEFLDSSVGRAGDC